MSTNVSTASWSNRLPDVTDLGSGTFDPSRIEDAVREGYDTGFRAGHRDGHAAGLAQGHDAAAAAIEHDRRQVGAVLLALRDQLHHVAAAEADIRQEFEAAVADAAVALAEAILGREVAASADPGGDALRRALSVAPSGPTSLLVHLHPADAEHLGSIDGLAPGRELTIIADPTVTSGGCRVVVGDTTIDAGIRAALDRVREALQ